MTNPESPWISVIIPCYGHARELADCLRALEAQRTDAQFEVIVVDSTGDSSADEVMHKHPIARLIHSPQRLFAGEARNLGVQEAAGDGLAFIDADCIPSPFWIEQARRSLQAGNKITGGSILDAEPIHAISWVDNRLQFSDFQKGRTFGYIRHVPSCNFVTSRKILHTLGGFDIDVETGEDALLLACASASFEKSILFDPSLRVYHQGRRNWKDFLRHQYSLGFYRGKLGLMMTPAWETLASSPLLAGLSIVRRFGYIGSRIMQYDRASILRFALYTPLMLAGLIEWTRRFYLGVSVRIQPNRKHE